MKKVLVGLDELLDTRLAMVALHNPELVEQWLSPGSEVYQKRMMDNFLWESLGWSQQEWEKKWNARDVSLLHHAVVTHIPQVLVNIYKIFLSNQEQSIEDRRLSLTVNTYPYQLNDEEEMEMKDTLREILTFFQDIEFVHRPWKDFHFKYIKENYRFIVMYDFMKWVDSQGEEFIKEMMPLTHFFIPRLFLRRPDDALLEDKEVKKVMELDMFKIIESAYAPRVRISFIPASDFGSILLPPVEKTRETMDLDDRRARGELDSLRKFHQDPLYPFRPVSGSSEGASSNQT